MLFCHIRRTWRNQLLLCKWIRIPENSARTRPIISSVANGVGNDGRPSPFYKLVCSQHFLCAIKIENTFCRVDLEKYLWRPCFILASSRCFGITRLISCDVWCQSETQCNRSITIRLLKDKHHLRWISLSRKTSSADLLQMQSLLAVVRIIHIWL